MAYSIDSNVSETSVSKFIQVTPESCVSKGRFFDDFTVDLDKNYLDVLVRDQYGLTAKKRYFIPKLNSGFITNQEILDKEEGKFVKILTNISRRFLGEDYASPQASSLLDLTDKVIKDIKTKCPDFKNKEMWIKIVLDKSNFPTLPNYSPVCYEGTLTADQVKTKGMSVNTTYDKVVRTAITPTSDPTPSAAPANSPF